MRRELSDEEVKEIMDTIAETGRELLLNQRRTLLDVIQELLRLPEEQLHEALVRLLKVLTEGMVRLSEENDSA